MQTVTELLSESKRKVMYVTYGLIGVGLGATQTAFTAAEIASPLWLVVAFSVYLYIGGAFGLVAAQNVGSQEIIIGVGDETTDSGEPTEVNLGKHGVIGDEFSDEFDAEFDIPEIVELDETETRN